MRAWIRQFIAETVEGTRLLCSRRFWRSVREYYSADAISGRLDDLTSRIRENTGQSPDWDVERRRAARGLIHVGDMLPAKEHPLTDRAMRSILEDD